MPLRPSLADGFDLLSRLLLQLAPIVPIAVTWQPFLTFGPRCQAIQGTRLDIAFGRSKQCEVQSRQGKVVNNGRGCTAIRVTVFSRPFFFESGSASTKQRIRTVLYRDCQQGKTRFLITAIKSWQAQLDQG